MTHDEFWSINSSKKAQLFVANVAKVMNADVRAVNVMINTVCNLDGAKAKHARVDDVPAEDLKLAKSAGLIRDSIELTHAQVLSRIIKARDQIDRAKVAAAFVSSLGSGLLFLRSPLGSMSHALHLKKHRLVASKKQTSCYDCWLSSKQTVACHRFTWRRIMYAGNIEQGDLEYVLCDLEDFGSPSFKCTGSDKAILKRILATIRKLPDDAGLRELQKSLTGLFKANKYERQVVLEILGTCGVLKPTESASMHESWVPRHERPWPTHFYRKDWKSPVNCWTGADGVNEDAVDFWFGDL